MDASLSPIVVFNLSINKFNSVILSRASWYIVRRTIGGPSTTSFGKSSNIVVSIDFFSSFVLYLGLTNLPAMIPSLESDSLNKRIPESFVCGKASEPLTNILATCASFFKPLFFIRYYEIKLNV